MILIEPQDPETPTLTTAQILSVISDNAEETALILLPGVQFYTGQAFDICAITKAAQSKGITVGWDLAHAVGNLELHLHDWNVDFAAWCSYKYLNSGPGSIGGIFVHDQHGKVDKAKGQEGYRPRLAGWWGGDKTVRFKMENHFLPMTGAAGFQVSNTSALDLIPITVSLEIFGEASMKAVRRKSIAITAYLEYLLLNGRPKSSEFAFKIITPSLLEERGAQLSVQLKSGLLAPIMTILEGEGVVVDEREPDVVRIAPAPLYNSFEDVWRFSQIFGMALEQTNYDKEGLKK
jgi:kynureninase